MVGCAIAQGPRLSRGMAPAVRPVPRRGRGPARGRGRAAGGTLYVTLEPCCHVGKTPPCTRAILAAGIRRVVPRCATRSGRQRRRTGRTGGAGVEVEVGLLEAEARRLNAPYLKLVGTGRPWIIAKWAMTLDGKLATRTGESQWISNAESRPSSTRSAGAWTRSSSPRDRAPRRSAPDRAPARPADRVRIVLDTQASLVIVEQASCLCLWCSRPGCISRQDACSTIGSRDGCTTKLPTPANRAENARAHRRRSGCRRGTAEAADRRGCEVFVCPATRTPRGLSRCSTNSAAAA